MNTEVSKKSKFIYLPLLVLMFTQIGTSGDNAVLSVATNALMSALHANMNDIQLANMVYSLCAGAFMIAGGMLGIIIGWKKNFRIGVVLAILGEFMLALSSNVFMFIWGGRFLVGLGASFMIPSVLGLIPGIYEGNDRVFAFGAIGAATGIAACVGPIVAGVLLDKFGFRIAFGALAVYFILILAGSFYIPDVKKSEKKLKLDLVGIVGTAIGLFIFLIGISKVSVWGLITPIHAPFTIFGISPAIPCIIFGLVILGIMVVIEKRVEEANGCALLPQSFIKSAQVRAGLVASAMVFLYLGATVMLINPYLQLVGGFNAVMTGVAMISVGLPMFLFSMGIPKFFPNAHPKKILQIGYILLAVSVIPMAFSLQETGVSYLMYVGLAIAGAGQGMVSAQASNVVAVAVNERDAQQSGGIQATARNVGQAIGVALLGMVMIFTITSDISGQVSHDDKISNQVAVAEESKTYSFLSDQNFEKTISDIQMSEVEKQESMHINAEARIHSTSKALYVLGFIAVLCLFTTPGIKKVK
ncbi:MFS transporter [Absiella sp. AM54-8XD]|uniref:MFS transporter n=1 Tax=unclassified Amedibacterium TaxID=3088137 RepID=UPI000E42AF14|nr:MULTISPECIES: MFS transporter [unclassified Absiella]RGC20456.1 MFS transporter [Absiella sp. AM54-8XD]RGC51722.1 MFS transporter [Absiella sp. AM29-15]